MLIMTLNRKGLKATLTKEREIETEKGKKRVASVVTIEDRKGN